MRRTVREVDQAAKDLRRRATAAESVLWEHLRAGRLDGFKFRRQHPVGRCILDFYCADKRLCVEVDGSIHDEQQDRDAARDEVLASYNVAVLRIRNDEIMADIQSVLARIHAALHQR